MSHPMDNYIRDRMIIDAHRVIALAEQQSYLEHQGLKGRFRELLVDGILEPWLPPTVQCATGTVISWINTFRNKTQEDILLIDRSISPAVLLKPHVQEGVYLRNSVLARIEVKSSLDSKHIENFKDACHQFRTLGIDVTNEQAEAKKIDMMELNMLFAFKSAMSKEAVLSWFGSTIDGSISAVCVPEHGLWRIGCNNSWLEYHCQTVNIEAERLAAFVGLISNTAFNQHMAAQGRDSLSSLESGVGQYFNSWIPVEAKHGRLG